MTTPNEQAGTFKCIWCLKPNVKPSEWEQQRIKDDTWHTLCKRCATKRLNNPMNALLPMRKVERVSPDTSDQANTEPHSELAQETTPSKAVTPGYAKVKRYQQSDKGKETIRRRDAKVDPTKLRARRDVRNAVASGKIKKGMCFCGESRVGLTDAHHLFGYGGEDRMAIVWLCRKHHLRLHNEQTKLITTTLTKHDEALLAKLPEKHKGIPGSLGELPLHEKDRGFNDCLDQVINLLRKGE